MKSQKKGRNFDWLGMIGLILIVVGGVIVSYHLITKDIHSCTSDPLRYLIEDYLEVDHYERIVFNVYTNADDVRPIISMDIAPKTTNWDYYILGKNNSNNSEKNKSG